MAALGAVESEAASSDELDGFAKTGSTVRRARGVVRRFGGAKSAFERGIRPAAMSTAAGTASASAEGAAAAGASTKAASAAAGTAMASGSGGSVAAMGSAVLLPAMAILAAIVAFVLLIAAIDGGEDEYISELSENENIVANLLRDRGFDDLHIAAIMGNWACESENNSRQVQHGFGYCYDGNGNGVDDCYEQDNYPPELIGNPKAGYGLAQWTYPSRCRALVSFAASAGRPSGDPEVQVSFFCVEFAGLLDRFNSIDDLEQATRWFHEVYEMSGDTEAQIQLRVAAAQRIYDALTHSGSAGYMGAAMAIANDDSHGYSMDQRYRNPDVDCSSYVYYSLLDAGWTRSELGPTPFTTFNMGPILEGAGFSRLPYTGMGDLVAGDILVNPQRHTEIYYGDGQNLGAHQNYDGRPGDSSGREVCLGGFWDAGWTDVYRRAA